MEEEPREILSPLLEKPMIQKQFDELGKITKEARKRIDYTLAHNPEMLKAINIVERFLRKERRVCYGGQAINSLLPKSRKFYDTTYDVPDYDFFSPDIDGDTEKLVKELEDVGFINVSKNHGVHEGTMKVFVNFVAVADISSFPSKLFRIVQKRAKVVNGIYYCDPEFLRMMMYLELSRPRGEVDRWKKVYERLLLLNESYPIKSCQEEIRTPTIPLDDRALILDFCVKHKRVVVAPEMIELFEKQQSRKNMTTLVQRGGPVMFFSHQAGLDADDIQSMMSKNYGPVRVKYHEAPTDQLFTFYSIKRVRGSVPIALIFQEDACHSYTLLKLDEGMEMRLAMPDLYMHLYYAISIFGREEKKYFETSFDCLIEKIFTVAMGARNNPTMFLPAFGLRCSGRQKSLPTLLREKSERIAKEKAVPQTRSKVVKKERRNQTRRL